MSEGIFGRMFGPCLRGWWQGTDTNASKYIDYAPNRKWRYKDKTLMSELTKEQVNTTDVMDLADDEYVNGKIASTGKLQLHDNVFVNPLTTEENNNTRKTNDTNLEDKVDTNIKQTSHPSNEFPSNNDEGGITCEDEMRNKVHVKGEEEEMVNGSSQIDDKDQDVSKLNNEDVTTNNVKTGRLDEENDETIDNENKTNVVSSETEEGDYTTSDDKAKLVPDDEEGTESSEHDVSSNLT